jgi:hypothetical protein
MDTRKRRNNWLIFVQGEGGCSQSWIFRLMMRPPQLKSTRLSHANNTKKVIKKVCALQTREGDRQNGSFWSAWTGVYKLENFIQWPFFIRFLLLNRVIVFFELFPAKSEIFRLKSEIFRLKSEIFQKAKYFGRKAKYIKNSDFQIFSFSRDCEKKWYLLSNILVKYHNPTNQISSLTDTVSTQLTHTNISFNEQELAIGQYEAFTGCRSIW